MYDCRDFIETILIKEDFDDPKERARRAAQKRKEKEEAAKKAMAASKLVSFSNWILMIPLQICLIIQ